MDAKQIDQLKNRIRLLEEAGYTEQLAKARAQLDLLTASTRWVYPEVAKLFIQAPPEAWPVSLHHPDGERVWFHTPAELLAATMPVCPECGEEFLHVQNEE